MTVQTIELTPIALITLAALVEAPALTLLRVGGIGNIAAASLIFALAVLPILSIALQYEGIGVVNFFWNILSTILMFIIGVLFFKEKLSNLQLLGVILSLLGLVIVAVTKE